MLSDVVVRDAVPKGLGVYALRAFRAGEFIFRRRHLRIVSNSSINSLPADDQRHLCELDWERSAVLASPGCYLNHSCEPNAMRSGVKVFAWREIAAGAEITIDYRLNAFGNDEWLCVCGVQSCAGTVQGSFFSLAPHLQEAYLPFAPPFIRREHRRRLSAVRSLPGERGAALESRD